MADNIAITPGTGATVATDDVAGIQFQKIKLDGGGDGVSVPIVAGQQTMAASLPVAIASNQTLPLPALAATSTKQSDGTQKTQIVDGSGNVVGSTTNALDVNIKSGSSSGTQYTEDAVAAADPVGNAVVLVRKDTPAATVTTDGDNIAQRGSNFGAAYVTLVDNAGAFVGVAGGTQYDRDTAAGAADKLNMSGFVRKDTQASLVDTDGDRGPGQMNASGSIRVSLTDRLDSTNDSVTVVGNIVDDAAFTPGTTKVVMAGYQCDETSTDSVDEGDGGAARMTADRKQIVNPQPHTTGGLTTFHLASAGSTNATVVKASAGNLFGWYIYNSNAAARKLVFHNAATTPTAGASVFFTITVPPTSAANLSGTHGIEFSTGIAITTVTGLADNDAVAVAANDLLINLFYK